MMDGDSALSLPVPKLRSQLPPIGLDEDISDETEEMVPSGRRKKKSRLHNLKGRQVEDDKDVSSKLAEMDITNILSDSEDSQRSAKQSHWSESYDYLNELEEPLTPTSSRKKKHKGALGRFKKEKNLNGSSSSLRSQEPFDLSDAADAADAAKPTTHTSHHNAELDGDFSMTHPESASVKDESGAIGKNVSNGGTVSYQDKTMNIGGKTENMFEKAGNGSREINGSREESEEEDDDTLAIEEQYKQQLQSTQGSHQLSVTKASSKGFPQPKPSNSIPKRIVTVRSESSMSKADSMPDISESASSSRRNWSFIKDRLGGSGADDLYESGLKKSFSTSSMNTLASSGLHTVRISTARHKNFLVGQQNSTTSMLGAAELDRTFPGRHVSIFVGTWNMADRKELPKKIEDFLLPRSLEFVPDVLVISSQENSLDRKEWEILLQETIGPNHVIYHSAQHGTLHITVCMKRELIWFCSMAEDDTATVRAFKQFKTKGAVAISFMMFGTSFLFLCSHLTANEGSSAVRVKDYYTINHSIKLPRAVVENSLQQVDSEASKRFDFVFWAGDLNFRITKEKDQVLEMVKLERKAENPNYGQLLESDELTQAMLSQEVFKEFHEGDIRFPPTYKFDIDTDNYDELRTPSYTDRILYMSRKRHTVVCEKYSSVPEITHSDHKPVYGLYQVNLKPGRDTIPLSGGQFRRDIYVEAAKRRALRRVAAEIKPANRSPNLASSSICTIS